MRRAGHRLACACLRGAWPSAARYCGIYPASGPGGWHLIGRTDATLFDPQRASARFAVARRPCALRCRMIEVLRAGLCDLVMDQGRFGYGALGVPVGGAADPAALAAANRLVGNETDAAGLEITLAGPVLRFPAGGVVALTGARFAASRSSGAAVAWNQTLVLAAGRDPGAGAGGGGCRCWLAVRGGLARSVGDGQPQHFFARWFWWFPGAGAASGGCFSHSARGGARCGCCVRIHQSARPGRPCGWSPGRRPDSSMMPGWRHFSAAAIGWRRRPTGAACGCAGRR